jgi:hypothetical protein
MDMAMTNELHRTRRLSRLAFALGLSLGGASAYAQTTAPPPANYGPSAVQDAVAPEAGAQDGNAVAAPAPQRRRRAEIRPYLEVAQVLSAALDGGETLTYTSVAAGVDGRIETRRVTAQASYRYERHIEWSGDAGDRDVHSGIAMVNAQVVPGVLNFDAGAVATRTGGEGRVFGTTNQDASVNVYSLYAGPTLSTHAGALAINGSYRLGYVKIDDDRLNPLLDDDFDSSIAHSATASIGMSPGRLPFGWTVGAGYARENSGGRFDQNFEGAYVRGDVVVPVGPTLALTAGVGYEDIQSDQRGIARDAAGIPVLDAGGRPIPSTTAPRVLTYDLQGVMYDGGFIWRPGPRTEFQARAGHRYGGTTVVGSFQHRFNQNAAINAQVYDTVETFGHLLTTDIGGLPGDFDANRDPLTGGLGGCVFGGSGGGVCLDRSLQSITGSTFRMRGGSVTFAGNRGRWTYGVGAGYNNRRYARPADAALAAQTASKDESVSVYGSLGRQLTRTSEVDFDAFVSWYSSDRPNSDDVTAAGANVGYSRSFLLDRLQMLAALGLYHTDDGIEGSTNASALAGLRYNF